MKREVFEKRYPKRPRTFSGDVRFMIAEENTCYCCDGTVDMGLAPGGRMKQEIYEDEFKLSDWDKGQNSRCFVHIANSMTWREITQEEPPRTPCTAGEYARLGMPWFMWYDDTNTALQGNKTLAGMKSVAALGKKKKEVPLPENKSVYPTPVIPLGPGKAKGAVKEFSE